MKRIIDDMAGWRLRQENQAKPFPYVFPQMPPRFRLCCGFARGLFLLEWGCIWALVLGGSAAVIVMLLRGTDALLEGWPERLLILLFFVLLPLGVLCRFLRHTPGRFWRCPCCGKPFPYYAPPLRGRDELKREACLYELEQLRIRSVKKRFCPLVVPSVCPACRCKFFDMGGSEGPPRTTL